MHDAIFSKKKKLEFQPSGKILFKQLNGLFEIVVGEILVKSS